MNHVMHSDPLACDILILCHVSLLAFLSLVNQCFTVTFCFYLNIFQQQQYNPSTLDNIEEIAVMIASGGGNSNPQGYAASNGWCQTPPSAGGGMLQVGLHLCPLLFCLVIFEGSFLLDHVCYALMATPPDPSHQSRNRLCCGK